MPKSWLSRISRSSALPVLTSSEDSCSSNEGHTGRPGRPPPAPTRAPPASAGGPLVMVLFHSLFGNPWLSSSPLWASQPQLDAKGERRIVVMDDSHWRTTSHCLPEESNPIALNYT